MGLVPDSAILVDCIQTKMPFGKYKGTFICDLPMSYLEWFPRKNGFPTGKIGMLLQTMYEIKLNGLDNIVFEIKKMLNNNSALL